MCFENSSFAVYPYYFLILDLFDYWPGSYPNKSIVEIFYGIDWCLLPSGFDAI
jgi:hypothetical protein